MTLRLIGSGIITGMALLKKGRMSQHGWILRFQKLMLDPVANLLILLPADQNVELLATSPAPYMSACHYDNIIIMTIMD